MVTTDPKSLLADVPIFADLSARSLGKLSALCAKQSFDAGEVLIEQGGTGLGLFLITSGRVEVFSDDGEERLSIAVLEAGQVVGEMSLLDDQPRSASVMALEPTEALLISRSAFHKLVRKEPEIAWCFVPVLVERLREAQSHEVEMLEGAEDRAPAPAQIDEATPEVRLGPSNGSSHQVPRSRMRDLLETQYAAGRAGLALAEESVSVFGRMLDTWVDEVGLESERPTSEVLRAMPAGTAKAWIAACRAAGGSPRRVLDTFRDHLRPEPDRSRK